MLKPSLPLREAKRWLPTLKLPRSTFPPRPVPKARPLYLKRCSDDLYALQSKRSADRTFVFHDGPPYANGSLHIGHALNKVLKDIVCRFQVSQGWRVQYIPGWDCHGLPIEMKALQGEESFRYLSPYDIRAKAKSLAAATIKEQKEGFKQWAVLGDWDNAYQTMDKSYELRQLHVFKNMVKQGLIYRQFKPVHWSPSSGTALAEAELEYDADHESLAAYVKFKVSNFPLGVDLGLPSKRVSLFALIWTTTPWTIPANRAIGINEQTQYCIFYVESHKSAYIVAQSLLGDVLRQANMKFQDVSIVSQDISGESLFANGSMTYVNPFQADVQRPFLSADFVSDKSGTGLVHMAPGHGFDDYNVCVSHGIAPSSPVDEEGRFTPEAYPLRPNLLKGKEVLTDGSRAVLDLLSNTANLENPILQNDSLIWATHNYIHSYPIDWRTKLPTIVVANAQWFADVGSIKKHALRTLEEVQFLPSSGKSRLESFISGRSQWCISRQRVWGVPIPALYASDGSAIMTNSSVEHIIKVIQERGIDAWWTDSENESAWIPTDLPAGNYKRGKDTMDVWFDSGTSWTLLPERKEEVPADVYLEGTDQHRGWFQSSLLTYIAQQMTSARDETQVKAPFKTLITHGFTLDSTGRKMSKSEGNVISPEEIMDGSLLPPIKKRKGQKGNSNHLDAMGPDALRLWVASSDYTGDVVVGPIVLKAVNSSLHKLRITFKWLLGALADFEQEKSSELPISYRLADQIALHQLYETVNKVHNAYQRYDFVRVISAINAYVNTNLSAFYFETAKDHLYTGGFSDRHRVQTNCFTIFKNLMSMLGPILPLLITEAIDHASPTLKPLLEGPLRDPLLSPWGPNTLPVTGMLDQLPSAFLMKDLFEIHAAVKTAQEEARTNEKLGMGLDCHVELQVPHGFHSPTYKFLQTANDLGDLADIFVVSSVSIRAEPGKPALGMAAESENQTERPSPQYIEWCFRKDVKLQPLDEASGTEERILTVLVQPPRGNKCPRCWRSVVERQPASICDRCHEAVAEMEFNVEQTDCKID